MSKGLKALERISEHLGDYKYHCKDYELIEKELKEGEKAKLKLKALEIIRKKQVQVATLLLSNTCAGYNFSRGLLGEYIEQDEYKLLKEVLTDE